MPHLSVAPLAVVGKHGVAVKHEVRQPHPAGLQGV